MDFDPMASTGMLPDYSVNRVPGLYPQASSRALLQSLQNIVASSCRLRCCRLAIVPADVTVGRVQRIMGQRGQVERDAVRSRGAVPLLNFHAN